MMTSNMNKTTRTCLQASLRMTAALLATLSFGSCGEDSPPGADLRGDSGPIGNDSGEPDLCARPSEGCECPEPGQQITCRPNLDECRMGLRTCEAGSWSACIEVDYDNEPKEEGIGGSQQGLQERIGVLNDGDGSDPYDACELCQPECVIERDYDFSDPSTTLDVCVEHRTPKPRSLDPLAQRSPNSGCYQQVTDVIIDPTAGSGTGAIVLDPAVTVGSFSRIYEGCHLGAWPYTDWHELSWNGTTTDDGYVTLEIRTGQTITDALADTPITIGGSSMTPLGGTINIGDELAKGGKINGYRYLHLTFTLNLSTTGVSPEVYDFQQKFYCHDEEGNLDPGLCSNGNLDPGETNADCGGICGPTCTSGAGCVSDLDCDSAVCDQVSSPAVCQASSCSDTVLNGGESDIDCGAVCATASRLCIEGETCFTNADCAVPFGCLAGVCTYDVCLAQTQIPVNECQELVDLYNATGGDTTWTNNWPEVNTPTVMPTPCSWYGITCNATNVVDIMLTNNGLTGSLPGTWLATGMPAMGQLRLNQNSITGPLPASMSTATTMSALWIGDGNNWGALPDLSALTNLQAFVAGNCGIGGPGSILPSWLGNLTSLSLLDVRNNAIEGTIPASIGNLPALSQLWLNQNQLSGPLPSTFPALGDTITVFHLNDNLLEGVVPFDQTQFVNFAPPIDNTKRNLFSLYNNGCLRAGSATQAAWLDELDPAPTSWNGGCTTYCERQNVLTQLECLALQATYASTNGDTWATSTNWPDFSLEPLAPGAAGPADPCTWYGVNCTAPTTSCVSDGYYHVFNLVLGNNNLGGTIPAQIGDLQCLDGLGLANNSIGGSIPTSIGQLDNLRNLFLSSNNLTGPLPVELGDMAALVQFWAANNQLSGAIPTTIGNLGDTLTYMELGNNQLSGNLPTELGNLSLLTNFYLYSNNLTGPIPASLANLTNVGDFRLNDNQLSGEVPAALAGLAVLEGSLTTVFLIRNNLCLYTTDTALRADLAIEDPSYSAGCALSVNTPSCANAVNDNASFALLETDTDCGSFCALQYAQRCSAGQSCLASSDCDTATAQGGCVANVCTECTSDANCTGDPDGPICSASTCGPLLLTIDPYTPNPDVAGFTHVLTGTTNAPVAALPAVTATVGGVPLTCNNVSRPTATTWRCELTTDPTSAGNGVAVSASIAYNGGTAAATSTFSLVGCFSDTDCSTVGAGEVCNMTFCNPFQIEPSFPLGPLRPGDTFTVAINTNANGPNTPTFTPMIDGVSCGSIVTGLGSQAVTCTVPATALPGSTVNATVDVSYEGATVTATNAYNIVECFLDAECDDGLACTTNACALGLCIKTVALNMCEVGGVCYNDGDNGPVGGPWTTFSHCDSTLSQTALSNDPTVCQDTIDIQNDFEEWIDPALVVAQEDGSCESFDDGTVVNWSLQGTGSLAVGTAAPYRASASYLSVTAGPDTSAELWRSMNTGQQFHHMRFYLRVPAGTVDGFVPFASMFGGTGPNQDLLEVGLGPNDELYYSSRTDGIAGSGTIVSRDRWMCVQFDYDLAGGKATVAIDGASVASFTGVGPAPTATVGAWNRTYGNSTAVNYHYDELVVTSNASAASIPCDP